MASYGTDGKINLEELNKNLKNNIPELTYQNSNKIEELPTTVTLEGHEITIDENGKVTIEEEKDTPTPPQKEKSELEKAKETGTILSATENTPITDSYGNEIIIPAGFKISEESSNNVTGGVVIEDATHTNTLGSEFVWIPVGTVYTNESKTTSETITLGRYVFKEDGTIDTEQSKTEPGGKITISQEYGDYVTEGLKTSTTRNTHAKDIETFIAKANSNHGYYIGRYEARTPIKRNTRDDELKQITVNKNDYIYNFITQPQAATLSQEMYNEENKFTSDLINSYAWDTAIIFLQTFDDRTNKTKPYSMQNSINTKDRAEKGTNNLTEPTKQDKICNIWDMASNNSEWTTETNGGSSVTSHGPCVYRGGIATYENDYYNTAKRNIAETYNVSGNDTFRVVLYL